MRKIAIFFAVVFVAIAISPAGAALEFNVDLSGDGVYGTHWPLKVGESVAVDIYVSNVPSPGLIAMGFKLVYDPEKLEIVLSGTGVDLVNWPIPYLETGTPGEMEMAGFSLLEHKGDHIRLGTVTFRRVGEGTGQLKLLRRDGDWFVLFSGAGDATVLDGDIGAGVLLAEIRPAIPGDVTGDGDVDLADAIMILRMITHLHHVYIHVNADVSGDGRIGLPEAIYILQEISGMK